MFSNVWECFFFIFLKYFFQLMEKIADYTVNLSWDTEGSKSSSASTGATTPPTAFTTFINSSEGDSFR